LLGKRAGLALLAAAGLFLTLAHYQLLRTASLPTAVMTAVALNETSALNALPTALPPYALAVSRNVAMVWVLWLLQAVLVHTVMKTGLQRLRYAKQFFASVWFARRSLSLSASH
jgi:hypothetical protein